MKKKLKKKLNKVIEAVHVPEIVEELPNFSGYANMAFSYNGIYVTLAAEDNHLSEMLALYDHLKDRLMSGGQEPDQFSHDSYDYLNAGNW